MKRFRDTTKYDKRWYMDLPPRLKCAVDFLHDKADNAGVWEPNYVLLNIGVKDRKEITEFEILTIDKGRQFLKLENGKIYCHGFIQFQYGELKETCKPHLAILKLLTKHNLKYEDLIQYPYPLDTLKEKDKEKERDKDMEKEKEAWCNYIEKLRGIKVSAFTDIDAIALREIKKRISTIIEDPTEEKIFDFWQIILNEMPNKSPWISKQNLSVINSKFDTLITDIKNFKNGSKSGYSTPEELAAAAAKIDWNS